MKIMLDYSSSIEWKAAREGRAGRGFGRRCFHCGRLTGGAPRCTGEAMDECFLDLVGETSVAPCDD